jgi:alpha,alpha-trehalose phosphorylase
VLRYVSATMDSVFAERFGVDLLVETARLWMSVGHLNRRHELCIDGVTGPDEYSALMDNNIYTNLMAQRNLSAAADFAEHYPTAANRLKVTAREIASWRRWARKVHLPYDRDLRVHKQATQFTDREEWDFKTTLTDQYPLFLHHPYFDLYRKQVIKQADIVLAMHLRGDAFTAEEKARNFAYYEARTVRDSSLSSCTQSIIAAEVGAMHLAYDYLGEAVLMDLHDVEHNVTEGLHMGSLAGAWQAVVAGLGGMRHHGASLGFAPRLPHGIGRLTFRMTFQDRLLKVTIGRTRVTYRLLRGQPIRFDHFGDEVRLARTTHVTCPIPGLSAAEEPTQPAGRAPVRRGKRPPRHLRRDGKAGRRRGAVV